MTKRRLNDWLSAYLKYTDSSESPVSYHLWSGVSVLSGALQRKVYLRWGHSTLYPNQYIILVGPSGRARKGDAIGIARAFMDTLKVPLIGEDNSQEAIILEMKNSITTFTDKSNGKLTFQCAVSCIVEELSVFTGEQNTQFLAYLTNWFDSRDRWKRTTKHQGTDEIMGMCFNMLAATAPDWIPYILPREAIGGGFTSRCIFIVEQGKSKIISNPNSIHPPDQLKRDLAFDLEVIHTLSGAITFDDKALKLYEDWYVKEETKIEAGNPPIRDRLFSGYVSRRSTHLRKLAMVMSVSRGADLTIIEKDFNRALKMLEIAEKKMPLAFGGIGKARYAEETEAIMQFIAIKGTTTKSEILNQFYKMIDDYSLDIIMKVLSGMRVVRTIIAPGETKYEYIKREAGPGGPTLQ